MSDNLLNKIKEAIPDLTGQIIIKDEKTIFVIGEVITSDSNAQNKIETILNEEYPGKLFSIDLKINQGLSIINKGEVMSSNSQKEDKLDEVDVFYTGDLPTSLITKNKKFKEVNSELFNKVNDCFKVLGFIAPIILDSNLTVIDGNMRLEIAQLNNQKKVPVVVLNASDKRTQFLRMILNRSSEFQRWSYSDLDDFVDNTPQVQPLAEPLGFFGKTLLPESFFSDTILEYKIDPFNTQQSFYQQEQGLADWAEYRRNEIRKNFKKKEEQTKKSKSKENVVSLFDLVPNEDDFIETFDIESEIEEHAEKMRKVADTITNNYDEIRKKEYEKQGKSWQGSRRSSKQVSIDNRNEINEYIQSLNTSDKNKDILIDNIEDYLTSNDVDIAVKELENEKDK